MSTITACLICGKAFEVSSRRYTCCSYKCSQAYHATSPSRKEMLRQIAATKKRPPRTDCKIYDPDRRDCHGLTGLWCEWENCKFYKPKEGNNEQRV